MRIPLHKKHDPKIRITFLSRKTKFRNVLNENELVEAIRSNSSYIIQKVTFERQVNFIF